MDSKEIKPVNLKGNQPWIFTRRTDAEAEAPILWSPDEKSRLIGRHPGAGVNYKLARSQSIVNNEQQGHLLSASMEIEPCATAAVDLQHSLREFRAE